MRNRRYVGFFESNEFVGQKPKRPAATAVRRIATGKRNEVGFIFAVKFALILTVGIAAMDSRDPVLAVSFSSPLSGDFATVEDLSDIWIAEALICAK